MQIWWRERFAKHFLSSDLGRRHAQSLKCARSLTTWVRWHEKGQVIEQMQPDDTFNSCYVLTTSPLPSLSFLWMVYGSPNVIWLKFCDVRCCIQVWVFSVLCWIDGEIPWFHIQKWVSWTTLVVHPAGTETFIAILWEDSQESSWIAATSPGSNTVYMKSHQSHLWTCFVSWVPAFSWLALISSIPSGFQVLKMISAWPLTGRMHQIRSLAAFENHGKPVVKIWSNRGAHMASLGHPIVGDRAYGDQSRWWGYGNGWREGW